MKLFFKSIKYSLSLIYRSSRFLILVWLFVSLFAAALGLASTYALKFLIDTLVSETILLQNTILWMAIYIAVLLMTGANQYIQSILHDIIFKKADHLYECDVNEKISRLPLSCIDSSEGNDMIDDVRYSKQYAVSLAEYFVSTVPLAYTFGAAMTVLIVDNTWLSLLLLALVIPSVILRIVYEKKLQTLRMEKAPDVRKFCYYRWMLTDEWPAKDVRMYDLTRPIQKRYNEMKDEYIAANKSLDKKMLNAMLVSEIIMRAGEVIFTIFTVVKALRGEFSIGDVTLQVGLALAAVSAFQQIMHIGLESYTLITEVMSRIFSFFSIPDEGKMGTRDLQEFESLAFQNVCFKYPYTDNDVLKGVSFTLNKGDKLSLVGINGSGKSTIIKLMLGLYEIESGEILLNGYPMSDYDIRDVRKLFSALFQSFAQYPLSLRDNIALSDYGRAADDDAVIAALKQSGVYDELQEKLENGLDSYMTRQFDDKGTELSKGQWQKVALSRAYFKNAQIFIFDEPSAALDAEAEDRIFRNFESISEGKTGIMISHRISAARMSNKILVLDGGVITESGTHDELIEKDGLYAKLYNLQKEKYTAKEEVS